MGDLVFQGGACTSVARAVLSVSDARTPDGVLLRCGLMRGHEGLHVFHMEWRDPSVTDEISAYLASRRDDPEFRARIEERMARDAEILRRLADDDGPSLPPANSHEFTENVADASMCTCGVPALTHDQVYPPAITRPVNSGTEGGT